MPLQNTDLPVALSDTQFTDAKTHSAALMAIVNPLLRHFTPEAIKRMTKYGPKSAAFIKDAEDAVEAVGDALPRSFNPQMFHDQILVMQQLSELLGPISAMVEGLRDAEMMVGSFLMQNGNFVFNQLRSVENLDPRVTPYVEEMGKRYENSGPKPKI